MISPHLRLESIYKTSNQNKVLDCTFLPVDRHLKPYCAVSKALRHFLDCTPEPICCAVPRESSRKSDTHNDIRTCLSIEVLNYVEIYYILEKSTILKLYPN